MRQLICALSLCPFLAVGCSGPNPLFEDLGDLPVASDGGNEDLSQILPDAAGPIDAADPIDAAETIDAAVPIDGGVDLALSPADLANPSCTGGTEDCDQDPATACDPLSTALHCGSCGTSCFPAGGTNTCVATGATHACQPACDATHFDCDGLGPNGCEVNLATDPGEPDNGCPGVKLSDVTEGTTLTLSTRRILPAGDTDTYEVTLKEGTHACSPLSAQPYVAVITLDSPVGAALGLAVEDDPTACTNAFAPTAVPGRYCYPMDGTCGFNDVSNVHFRVAAQAALTASCLPYTLKVRFCALGSTCDNCL